MKVLIEFLGGCLFAGFIAVKLAGHAFALWSWWWLLMPLVPWLGLLVVYGGL